MKIEQIPINDLIPYAHNAKAHPEQQIRSLMKTIQEFGFKVPVIVDKDNTLIAGHGRLLAAKELGLATVPAIRADDLTPEQARAFRIADNKVAESEWMEDILADEILKLDDNGFDMTALGFELVEFGLGIEPVDLPELPSGDKSPFQQITFTLHDTQAEQVKAAIKAAKTHVPAADSPNANSNGNAIATICEEYLKKHGRS